MYIGWDGKEYEDAEMDAMLHDAREEETMKRKMALIDIDRIIANADYRFAKAEENKQRFIHDEAARKQMIAEGIKNTDSAYWREGFNPAYVPSDTLIDGADGDIIALTLQGYEIIYLTSRPSSMWDATVAWLEQYDLLASDELFRLVMKEEGFRWVKTVTWKVGQVQTLARMHQAEEVLFVTDRADEIEELQKLSHFFTLRCATSLDEAVNGPKEDEDDDPGHPF
jgi:hypothetical protein